jgi:hypothetical protein
MPAEMGVALNLVAAVVGHEAGGKETRTLVRHYIRTDLIERKTRALMAWDQRVRDIVTGKGIGNVVRFAHTGLQLSDRPDRRDGKDIADLAAPNPLGPPAMNKEKDPPRSSLLQTAGASAKLAVGANCATRTTR